MRNLSRRRAIIAQALVVSAHLAARPATTAQPVPAPVPAPQKLSRGEQVRRRPDINEWNLAVKNKKAAKRRAKGK